MNTYRVIRLMKNHLYPTFQLYAEMKNTKTDPRDGLRLAALTTMEWLRLRLGSDIPEELRVLPPPEEYRTCTDDCLPSLHLSAGFVIDIVSMPEQGTWTLQISEPDLGPDPGNPEQSRSAVPGRVIETNVSFRAAERRLECGFMTVVSDPEGTEGEAEVYRLALVRRLAAHPDFGLKQITALTEDCVRIATMDRLRQLTDLIRNKENALPCVVFTQRIKKTSPGGGTAVPDLDLLLSCDPLVRLPSVPAGAAPEQQFAEDPDYDMANFAKYGIGLCRTYLLDAKLTEAFTQQIRMPVQPGETVIFEPRQAGGRIRLLPYSPNAGRRKEILDQLRREMYQWPKNREVSFGGITFLSAARENLLQNSCKLRSKADEVGEQWRVRLAQSESCWKAELDRKSAQCHALQEQLHHQQDYRDRLEREKQKLREEAAQTEQRCALEVAEKNEEIAYLRRKLAQPREHGQIAAWVRENFADRLILHKKAAALLEDRSCHAVDVGLICDALDFLATDYWEQRYAGLPREEMLLRCAGKYGRPFDISPTGTTAIEYTPGQYKIKYFPGRNGKPTESALDFHLRVGNDPENLLRIYFLHDDGEKRIVVGSLPKHLRAVTIQ